MSPAVAAAHVALAAHADVVSPGWLGNFKASIVFLAIAGCCCVVWKHDVATSDARLCSIIFRFRFRPVELVGREDYALSLVKNKVHGKRYSL
mmetsp:Transcript_63228/g.125011  ORF Transcript_63228/g.125011 Transcript_63228/m.125011 type:complete len:92 (+) Transcript_63228:837-1112(+)